MHITKHSLIVAVLLSLGLTACPGGQGETDSDASSASASASDSDSDSTTGSSTATTGDETGSSGSDSESATTGELTTGSSSGDPSTGSSSGEPTTGGEGELQESCESACEVLYACTPESFESEAQCAEKCLDGPMGADPDAPCEAATVAWNGCIAGSTCDELNTEGVCGPEYDAFILACVGEPPCELVAASDGSTCLIVEDCAGSERELYCEGDKCACLDNGEEVGSCASDACTDPVDEDALADKALECCGFEF